MKNKINKILVIVAVIAAITGGYIQKSQSSSEVSSLLLENVEALARGENDGVYCFGIGTVDCPLNNTKVDSYYAPYSLLY
ncbi:NVEALA domain-containing protein [Bacteroides oleiciplenus]|uniref:NVEALA protein n=1 Tax=Bacteroides oleiciplenus TaxID=626931 RepID=A0A3E5BE48_9BACE|nr:NVEALA domain-containing protein [Bacteroides oleiciplenus]RGN35877.1 hypothetical protein DXB65_10190 [Bacteroides oleiciplenus]